MALGYVILEMKVFSGGIVMFKSLKTLKTNGAD
jgi:hypothetical protein